MDPLKFLIFLKFISTLTAAQSTKVNIREHVKIIMDFYYFYQSTSMTILHFTKSEHVSQTNTIFNIARMISKEKMMTSIISFEELTPLNYYNKLRDLRRSVKPLNVIFITSRNATKKMKSITNNVPLYESINLLFFTKTDEDPQTDFCTFPVGNPFRLRFDTLLFVKCCDDNHIREWYLQYPNQTSLYDWATWDSKLGLVVKTKDSMLTKRGLEGRVLRIATVKNSYFIQWKKGNLSGFFGDLLLELQGAMNFTVKLVENTDTHGSWNDTKQTWTGALGLAVRGEVDLVVSDYSFSQFRMHFIDFTVPLISVKNNLYIKQSLNKPEVSWYGYFRPFNYNIWCAIILLLIITPILLIFMQKQVNKWLIKSKLTSDSFLDVYALFCQQGVSNIPTLSSIGLAYFSISASAYIILSVYSASLISSLAIPSINLPFKTIEDFVRDGTYKLAVTKDSSKFDILHSSNDSTFKRMTKLFLMRNNLPISLQDALNMACEERVAFYDRETAIGASTVKINCQLGKIDTGQIDTIAMIMPKHSPYKFMIDHHLRKMETNGLLKRIRTKYFSKNIFWTKRPKFKKVEFQEIVLLLAIVGGGIIFGTVLLLVEKFLFSYKNTMKNKRSKINVKTNKLNVVNLEMKIKKSTQCNKQREPILNFLKINYNHRVVQTPMLKLIRNDK